MEVPTFQSLGDAVADKLREANFSDIVSDGYSYFTFKNANRLALLGSIAVKQCAYGQYACGFPRDILATVSFTYTTV